MEKYQRKLWEQMLERIAAFEAGEVGLSKLASDLRGLLTASDLHDTKLISEFWDHFHRIDMEDELRTEGWAPPGAASDEALNAALNDYRRWVTHVLATTNDRRS
jgi:hypothetical protein